MAASFQTPVSSAKWSMRGKAWPSNWSTATTARAYQCRKYADIECSSKRLLNSFFLKFRQLSWKTQNATVGAELFYCFSKTKGKF